MSPLVKRIGLVLGILLGLLILIIITALLLFPAERIVALAEDRASQALGMPVSVESAGLSFAGIPALKVSGIALGPPKGSAEPLATIEILRVRVNLLKLLRRQVEIVSMDIIRPQVHFVLQPPDTTVAIVPDTAAVQSGPPSLPVPLTLSSLSIRDGRVQIDQYPEGSIVLTDIDQQLELSLDRALTALSTTGRLSIGDLSISNSILPEPLSGLAITFEHTVSGDISAGSFDLTRGVLAVNDIPLPVTGSLRDWARLAVAVKTGDIDAGAVLDILPGSLLPIRDKLSAGGTFSFSVNTEADLAEQSPPSVSGTFAIDRMRLAHDDFPRPIDAISAKAAFTESALTLEQLSVETGSSSLRISGVVDSLDTTPVTNLRISGHLNVPDFTAALPIPNGEELAGIIDLDLAVAGSGTDPVNLIPAGTVGLSDFAFVLPKVLNHPALATGSLTFDQARIALENLDIRSGVSDFRFTGTIDSYRNLLDPVSASPAAFTSRLTSALIDIEDLMVIDREREIKIIKPWEMKDAIEAMPVPPNLTAELAIDLGTITFGRITAQSASGIVRLADGLLTLVELSAKAYQGTLAGDAEVDFSNPENPTYSTAFALTGFESGGFLADLFNREQFMRGTLNTNISLAGAGLDSLSMLNNLTGEGAMQIADGEIDNWEFTRKLGDHLSFLDFDVLAFDTIANTFRIENRQVITPDMRVKTDRVSLTLDGATGFDSSIDYTISLALDRDTSQRAAEAINVLAGLIDGNVGELTLTVQAGGTITSPAFSLDTSEAQAQLKERAKQTVREQAEKLIDERLEDSELKEKGKELLKNLFR